MQYHRRYGAKLPSSEWDRAFPPRYGRSKNYETLFTYLPWWFRQAQPPRDVFVVSELLVDAIVKFVRCSGRARRTPVEGFALSDSSLRACSASPSIVTVSVVA